jgi:hypothetical protein
LTKGTAAEPYARIAAGVGVPMLGGAARLTAPKVATAPRFTENVAGVDVPLSPGQATGNTTQQLMENAALRGAQGNPAQQVAERFFTGEQAPAVEQARDAVQQGLDRFGQTIADNPQEAAELASESTRKIAQASKKNYGNLYDEALSMPGEFHAATFEGIGQKIKGDQTLSKSPVIIDDVTTPVAARVIQHIDNNIGKMRIQNRADPFGAPNPENITGVNLQGVDQTRKQLIAMASAAQPGSADRRAVSRIIGAFDDRVQNAMSEGLFTGDDRALDAIKDARAAYAQHKTLFSSQGAGDDVGRAMENIIGRNRDGATPTEVSNYLYGQAKVGGTGLSVRLALRMQQVLGADSPEWAAIRQGLWSRLSEATEGATAMGPQKTANRVAEFLNGSGQPLANVMFTQAERDTMSRYAALQRQVTPKPGAVNYSNSGVLMSALKGSVNSLFTFIGASLGGPVGAVAGHVIGPMGAKLKENMAGGALARQLYQTRSPTRPALSPDWKQRALLRGLLAARGGVPSNQEPAR